MGKVLACVESDLTAMVGPTAASFRKTGGITTSYSAFWTWFSAGWSASSPCSRSDVPPYHSAPVAFRIRFPDIETFRQRDADVAKAPVAPAVAVEDGEIAINCVPRYLLSFLSSGNLGDRLMVSSLVRGVDSLCGREAVSDAVDGGMGAAPWSGPTAPVSSR